MTFHPSPTTLDSPVTRASMQAATPPAQRPSPPSTSNHFLRIRKSVPYNVGNDLASSDEQDAQSDQFPPESCRRELGDIQRDHEACFTNGKPTMLLPTTMSDTGVMTDLHKAPVMKRTSAINKIGLRPILSANSAARGLAIRALRLLQEVIKLLSRVV